VLIVTAFAARVTSAAEAQLVKAKAQIIVKQTLGSLLVLGAFLKVISSFLFHVLEG
jgi:hypothetical protein